MIYALVVVIAVLVGLIGWMDYNHRLERQKLVNALMAKNAQEQANLDMADKTKIKVENEVQPVIPPDLVPENQMTDEEFDKFVLGKDGS